MIKSPKDGFHRLCVHDMEGEELWEERNRTIELISFTRR